MNNALEQLGLTELHERFVQKSVSPVEYTRHMLELMKRESLNSIVTVDEEAALAFAKQSEQRYAAGEAIGPLDGALIGVKDIIRTKGIRTTFGCGAYKDYIPDEDAFAIAKLKAQGVNVSVKTNTSQFAMGPMGDVSYNGPVLNPHDPQRVSGGSSSGSAAAVAGFLCAGTLGTDSGGSIRIPSALCGVVGLKPTFSLVSNEGAMPVNEAVDTIGPITRSVQDNALILNAIAGYNPRDLRSAPLKPENYLSRMNELLSGGKVAFVANSIEGVEASVEKAVRNSVSAFSELGAIIRETNFPQMDHLRTAHQLLLMAGAHMEHKEDVAQHRSHIYEQVYNRLMKGDLNSDQYVQYERMRHEMVGLLYELLGDSDVLLLPTSPAAACLIGQKSIEINGTAQSPLTLYPTYSWIASYSGFPSITIPAGKDDRNMPVGISLIARPFDEANLYRYAGQLEHYMK
ncbi:amidase [Paenibacillus xylaniclasticus]|uniref:amidase n=1 Tax=Paenibacillus xylaniclasticus TaxID=588083 RepID=UPI0013E023C5|nr:MULTISPECIES: amidase [Paenibacillus]GFN33155.1 amidase [Paenibacillus curdlanolyticus]